MIKEFIEQRKNAFTESEVLHNNELQANRMVSNLMIDSTMALAVTWVLATIGVFPINVDKFNAVSLIVYGCLLLPAIISRQLKHDRWWLKYMLIGALIIDYALVDMRFSHKVVPLIALPVVVSSRYFSKQFTIATMVTEIFVFAVAAALSPIYGWVDMNVVSLPKGTALVSTGGFLADNIKDYISDEALVKATLLYSFIPKIFIFFLIGTVSINIAKRGREMVSEQDRISRTTTRIESELSLARDIQASMLPVVFPPFSEKKDLFDIYALMQPAKEVAGDFYDFFLIDDDHLAIVIADVSGKSVPAAMFMMQARTLIKNTLLINHNPAEMLTEVNKRLCEGNDRGFFVTGWIGVLDINTGHMVYSNAGHTPPAICRNGMFTFLKCKPGFILGGLDTIHFELAEIQLKPQEAIYLFTDGVDEAENARHELFGNDRLLEVLNENSTANMQELCLKTKSSVEYYAREVEQFDDITMLALRYLGNEKNVKYLTVDADLENLATVTKFIDEQLEAAGCPPKTRIRMDVVLDELFSNISKHAYAPGKGKVTIRTEILEDSKTFSMTLLDSGVEFDPTAYINPELEKPAKERKIGGLGLFLVRKTVDEMIYKRENGQNILTVTKRIDQ